MILRQNDIKIESELLAEMTLDIGEEFKHFSNKEYWKHRYSIPSSQDVFKPEKKGICFNSIPSKKANDVYDKYYDKLVKNKNYIFLMRALLKPNLKPFDEIVILNCNNQFEIIEYMDIRSIGHRNFTNVEIIAKLKEWEKQVRFRILKVDDSWIQIKLLELPNNTVNFIKEVVEFCPDLVIGQFTSKEEGVIKLANELEQKMIVDLWWDG